MVFQLTDETFELLQKSNKIYESNFNNSINFSRAIFVSWYCSLGDCKFCFMSTQKEIIKDPSKAKRHPASILAEIYISKILKWDIEFISAGYSGVTEEELLRILKFGSRILENKLWLNTGYMSKEVLKKYIPYLEGISGSIETLSDAHDFVCPSKPIKPYEKLYSIAENFNLKKAITLIIGIGETKKDLQKTIDFINQYNIERITLYSLRPVKNTYFTEAPEINYYLWWLSNLRINFPNKQIIAGIWSNDLNSIPLILKAGANYITKFPVLKKFGKSWQEKIDSGEISNREFIGVFDKIPIISKLDIDKDLYFIEQTLRDKINIRVIQYLNLMKRSMNKT